MTDFSQYRSINLEFAIAPILARQQAKGVLFDLDNANALLRQLMAEKVRLKHLLQITFKPRILNLGTIIPKVSSSKYHTKKGAAYTKIEFQEYNPSSRPQTIDRLVKEMGWEPAEFTDKGNPTLTEEIIEILPFEHIKPLKDYLTVDQRLKQLETGKISIMNSLKADGRIHGGIMQSGTVTGRMAHFRPNMNIPRNDKPWGKEFRALFTVPPGKIMIGCDADSLEARTLGGFLKAFDKGEFIKAILTGKKEEGTDLHSLNSHAYQVNQYPQGRDCSKTLLYGTIYGCGHAKRGLILQSFGVNLEDYVGEDFAKKWQQLRTWSVKKDRNWSDNYCKCFVAGQLAAENFGNQFPALPALIADVTKQWKARGYLLGLDGRKLFPRTERSVFNTLNQSAGAIIMKKALQIADDKLSLKLEVGKDYEFILNVHDEMELEVLDDPEVITYTSKTLLESIKEAGEFFKFPTPMKGNVTVGKNWSECH